MTNPDRIIVVSDAVSHDDLRKSMIMEAAPPGVKAQDVYKRQLLCCCRAIHERYSRAASHACLDGRDALELDDSREVRHGEIARRQVLFENLARARSRLAQDEALAKKVANGAGPGNVGSKLCGGGAPLGICRVVDLGFSSRPVRDASSCPGSDDPLSLIHIYHHCGKL